MRFYERPEVQIVNACGAIAAVVAFTTRIDWLDSWGLTFWALALIVCWLVRHSIEVLRSKRST